MAEAPRESEPDDVTEQADVDLPGLSGLRIAARYAARHLPRPPDPKRDGAAGLSVAIANVPDGLANGLLVGVNPVFGLYASMVGPLVAGLLSSTRLMVVTATAAASLTAGQALATISPDAREGALFLMVVLVGVFQVIAGLLKLGRLIRFISYSVTTGFLTGVAILLILSQLPTLAGYEAEGPTRLAQLLDLVVHFREIRPGSLATGGVALALAIVLPRFGLGSAGRLIAIIVPSAIVAVAGMDVRIVRDIGEIPRGLPTFAVPVLANSFDVVTAALAVGLVILVQGAGVSQSVPNPDGPRNRLSRDFIAQGAANLVSGLFRGIPVGGSVSATALSVLSGASTRWAAVFAGVWMFVIVLVAPVLVGYVAMPALGALLLLVGTSAVRPADVAAVWLIGWPARVAGGATFFAMLVLPIQTAVGFGAVLSALLYVTRSSTDVSVVELVEREDGRIEERNPDPELPSEKVVVLDVYGHLFYAGARTLERLLPRPDRARRPVVVLRLRGLSVAGATLVDVLAGYARALSRVGGRLYLSGISNDVQRQLVRMEKLRLHGPVQLYEATAIRGESTGRAYEAAESWLVSHADADAAEAAGEEEAA